MRPAPREGWILAGTLDGQPAAPSLVDDVAGIPYALRLAGELALAGAARITVIWAGPGEPPDLAAVARDPRLAGRAELVVVTAVPAAPAAPSDGLADGSPIAIARADRVAHRDSAKQVIAAYRASAGARAAALAGDADGAVVVADAATARDLALRAPAAGGLGGALAALGDALARAEPPYLGFVAAAPDARALRRAERQLVWSLRKSADGIAAKLLNRRLSLPISWLLCRTRVHPNHVTVVALLCALAGGLSLAQGGYAAGAIGMLLVEAGSIIDGIDGELARLKFLFSRVGQWLDTVADDLGNVAYTAGAMWSLHLGGATWAVPLGAVALTAFALTQGAQYYLIARVYRSGDLAAIPWAFQSSEFLSQRPRGVGPWLRATAPKLLKRDFAVTLFLVCALLGHLEVILLVFSGGALTFFAVFAVQLARNLGAIRRHRAATTVVRRSVVHAGR
jgi:phosphatidylglycerophosphate synthase